MILFMTPVLTAQEQNTFMYFDSLTYKQYLDKDWKNLENTSKKALKEGLDYYYLRMRTGIAMFERGKYMKAIPQFRNAVSLNNLDPVAREYLYYSMAFSGREMDAMLFYKNNEHYLESKVKLKKKSVQDVSVDAALHFNFESNFKSLFDQNNLAGIEGSQTITRRYFNSSFLLKHQIGKRLILYHGGTLLIKYDYYYTQSILNNFESDEHSIRQYQYYAGLSINPGGGFIITPAFHYIRFNSPPLSYHERRAASQLILPGWNANYYLGRLSVFKHFWLLDNGLGFTYSELSNHKQVETDYKIAFYPLGNLNLYVIGTAYAVWEDPTLMTRDMRFAYDGLLGFRLSPKIWLEADILAGEIKNMATSEGFIIYNGNETITSKYALSLIIPAGTMTFSLRGALLNYYSTLTDIQGMDTNINKLNFSGLSLIGGIKWNL